MNPSRREVLSLAGAGLFIYVPVDPAAVQERERQPGRGGYPSDFNAYLKIGADGRVTGFAGKVELGQGVTTALAQLLAEELDVELDKVDMVLSDTAVCPWDGGTFGSQTSRIFSPVWRGAAAEAKAVLLAMAAEKLGVAAGKLSVKAGIVRDGAGKQVSYAGLVAGQRIEKHLPKAPWKAAPAHSIVGRPAPRKDALAKVTGKAKFAGDFLPAGVLHARVLREPAHGATLVSADTSAAEKVAGVRVVRDHDLIAVLAPHRDAADAALALVKAEWKRAADTRDDRSIYEHLVKTAPTGRASGEKGNLEQGAREAATLVEETYYNAYVAHAAMETHSATAVVEKGKATVWASTQTPFPVRQQIAQALRLPQEDVRVVAPYVGGGFGGKSASRQALEAARLAQITGQPVQVVWDRAEEFFHDTFRPAAVVKIRSGLTATQRIAFWDFTVYCAGDREAKQFYDIPHERTVVAGSWGNVAGLHPFATGPWRAPAVNTNTFARESHIDILAAKAGADPVEFRLRHLSDKRLRATLETAAQRFGWKPGKAPSGRGVGVACALYLGSYVTSMAEVAVDKASGRVTVKRVLCVLDEGLVVNPEGSRQQIEGAITMGLGYALTEGVRFRAGEVLDKNFGTYAIPRFSWLPQIDAVLMDVPGAPPMGCGEPPIVTMGAVVANAIFDACGARLRELPMTPERVRAAIGIG